jgi:hypothetical protein
VHALTIEEQDDREALEAVMRSVTGTSTQGYSKESTALAKLYADSQKYKERPDEVFAFKFDIFSDHCDYAGLLLEARAPVFSTILKGEALRFYFSACRDIGISLPLHRLYRTMRERFEGPEHQKGMLEKWNSINLRDEINANRTQSLARTFTNMVQWMYEIKPALDSRHRTNQAL